MCCVNEVRRLAFKWIACTEDLATLLAQHMFVVNYGSFMML